MKTKRMVVHGMLVIGLGLAVAAPVAAQVAPGGIPESPPRDPGFEPENDSGGASPMSEPREKPDGTMHVHLRDGSTLIGKLAGATQLKIKSQFGEVAVPIRTIAVMQYDPSANLATITMHNEDRITGEMLADELKVVAEWGQVSIERKHLLGMIAKNMTKRYQRVRRAVVVETPEGQSIVRTIDEIIAVPQPSNPYPPGSYYPQTGGYQVPNPPTYTDPSVPGGRGGFAAPIPVAPRLDGPAGPPPAIPR